MVVISCYVYIYIYRIYYVIAYSSKLWYIFKLASDFLSLRPKSNRENISSSFQIESQTGECQTHPRFGVGDSGLDLVGIGFAI